jgi:hypothetical protein
MIPETFGAVLDYRIVNQLTIEDVMAWVNERLEGNFSRFPANERKDDNPVNLFAHIVKSPHSTPATRKTYASAVLEVFTSRMHIFPSLAISCSEPALNAARNALTHLAITTGFIADAASDTSRSGLASNIRANLRNASFLKIYGDAGQHIAVSFLSLRQPSDVSLWCDIGAIDPSFEPIAMQGLGANDFRQMIHYVCSLKDPSECIELLPLCLDTLIDIHGRKLLHELLKESLPGLSGSAVGRSLAQVFRDACLIPSVIEETTDVQSPATDVILMSARRNVSLLKSCAGVVKLQKAIDLSQKYTNQLTPSMTKGDRFALTGQVVETTNFGKYVGRHALVYDFTLDLQKIVYQDVGYWLFCHEAFRVSDDGSQCEVDVRTLRKKANELLGDSLELNGGVVPPDNWHHLGWLRQSTTAEKSRYHSFGSPLIFFIHRLFERLEDHDRLARRRQQLT